MSVDEIRRMPPEVGLLAYRNRRSVLLDLTGWDRRRDAREIKSGKATTEQEQLATFGRPTPIPIAEEAES
nr:hypothetical protein [Microbacterium telephonicum]